MTPLLHEICEEIRANGPIGLDRYIGLCLGHPVHGYYRKRDPLGRGGDFVTAPEISQMFGELLGVWIAATWQAMGAPAGTHLVELGPGRGTLLADALRALARLAPDAGFRLHLVETSQVLRAIQAQRIPETALPAWHESIESLPEGPTIVVANEFLDALPVRQFERTRTGWHERLVGLSGDGSGLAFGLSPDPAREIAREAPEGVVMTLPVAALALMRTLSGRLVREGGAFLAIDYGHARPGFGDSLQAVIGHRFANPLAAPGEADLSTHVDFAALAAAAAGEGAAVHGPLDQRDFLLALGLGERAQRLMAGKSPDQAQAIEAARDRLIDPGRTGMGSLFKAMAVTDPRLTAVPGLPAGSAG